MKNALILHGAGNNSLGNWFPWLKKVLEKKGLKVWLPDLPNSDSPDPAVWTKFILSNKDWEFKKHSIMIGHSAGATLILRLLENLPDDIKINKAILVAGYVELGTLSQYFKYKKKMVKGHLTGKRSRRPVISLSLFILIMISTNVDRNKGK